MNISTEIFNLEKWRGIKITLIAVALILAGCQSQAIPSTTTATPTEIPATATLLPSPTIQPPQAGAIVEPSAPTVEALPWSAPTGSEYVPSVEEPTPDFVSEYNLSGLGIIIGQVEYHTNGLEGNEYQWTINATDQVGNKIWAFDAAGKPLEYPMYFTPVKNAAGQTIRYDVSKTTPWGEPVTYKAIEGSRDADVVFVGDKLPTLVKDRVTTPDGKEVFLKYFDKTKGEWVDNQNVNVTDAQGNPLTWDGTEWKQTITGWWDVEPTTDLSPGSERVKFLDTLGLDKGFTISSRSEYAQINERFGTLGKVGVLVDKQVIPVKIGSLSGKAIVLFLDVKNVDGNYVREPILGGIQLDNEDSVGTPNIYGSVFNDMFPRASNGQLPVVSFNDLLKFYDKLVGKRVGFFTPVWKTDDKNPFDAELFALTMFPDYSKSSSSGQPLPGQSNYESYNVMYRFVGEVCQVPNTCYASQTVDTPGYYGDYLKMREKLAKNSPVGVFASGIFSVDD
jgi:hypothetical protein